MTFTYPSHTTKGCVPLSSDVIYFSDLTQEKQQEILEAFGDNGNFDVYPIVSIPEPEIDDGMTQNLQ